MASTSDNMLVLSLPEVPDSALMRGSRYRLPDSNISVAELQIVLRAWWKDCKHRDTTKLMEVIEQTWPGRGTPTPTEMESTIPYSFVHHLVGIDTTIHPRHSRLVAALIGEHTRGPVLTSGKRVEFEAMTVARSMLRMATKYRELAKPENACKLTAFYRRCTLEQRIKIDSVLSRVELGGDERSSGGAARRLGFGA